MQRCWLRPSDVPVPTPVAQSCATLEAMAHFDLGGLELHYSADSHSGVSFTDLSVIDNSGNFRR